VRRVLAAALLPAALAGGCGRERAALSPLCTGRPEAVLSALRSAPDPVRLADGTRLSECVIGARDDGEIQQLGFTLTPAADRLARARTPTAALRLGYLLGAVRHGAQQTNGIHVELVRRLDATATLAAAALRAALARGARAGEARG
jgi:hypothetical protein